MWPFIQENAHKASEKQNSVSLPFLWEVVHVNPFSKENFDIALEDLYVHDYILKGNLVLICYANLVNFLEDLLLTVQEDFSRTT